MQIVPKDIATYLRQFAPLLEDRILKQFPPLHEPGAPLPVELKYLRRVPYPAQSLAIAGIGRRWELENSAAAIVILSKSWPFRPRLCLILSGQIIVKIDQRQLDTGNGTDYTNAASSVSVSTEKQFSSLNDQHHFLNGTRREG